MCGTDGTYQQIYETDYVSFSPNSWYKLSFTAVGNNLVCSLYNADDDAEGYGSPLLYHELYDLNTTAWPGLVMDAEAPEFGTYSDTLYFARFGFEDLDHHASEQFIESDNSHSHSHSKLHSKSHSSWP